MMKSLGVRVCAATMVAGVALGGVAVVGDGNAVGVQRASAAMLDNVEIVDAYATTRDGDRLGKNITLDDFLDISDFTMRFRVPEGVKSGDKVYFYLSSEYEYPVDMDRDGLNVSIWPGHTLASQSTRIPILDPEGSTIAIAKIGSSMNTIEFTDAIEKYVGGEVRELTFPVTPHRTNALEFETNDPTLVTRDKLNLGVTLTIKQGNENVYNVSQFTAPISYIVSLREMSRTIGTTHASHYKRYNSLAAWVDERLYVSNKGNARSGQEADVQIAPSLNPQDVVFYVDLPKDAIVSDPNDVRIYYKEVPFYPYSEAMKNGDHVYGYTDWGEAKEHVVYRRVGLDDPNVSYVYDAEKRRYTITVSNRTPDTHTVMSINPKYVIPMEAPEFKDVVRVGFVSGLDVGEYVYKDDVEPDDDPKDFEWNKKFGWTNSDDYEPHELELTARVGEGNFDGTPLNIDYDVDVYVEDASGYRPTDVKGETQSGASSHASSQDEAVFVEDGKANYVLKITNNSNVALSAPRVTLPSGEVVQFARPSGGDNKRWADTPTGGSKIPPGGVGYLVLPEEAVPYGTQPTQKDFKVEYQYVSEKGNTQTASTWIQRFLPDMHVMDITQYGDEVKVAVGTEDDGVVDVYSFVMTNGVSSVKYDKVTGRLIVTKGPNDVDTLTIANPRISVGDDGSVVVTGVDAAGKPVETTLHTLKFVTRAFEGIGTDAQERIAKLIGDIDAAQGLADAQTERIGNVSDAAESVNSMANEANIAVRDVHTDVLAKIIASSTLTQSQIQQATQEVESARNAVDVAIRETALVREQLSQFDRDIVALRGRIDGIDAEYQEVVKTYESHERYLKQLTEKVSQNEIALAQLRLDVEAAQNNADENTADIAQLRSEISTLESQIAKDRAAFEAEKKKTAKHRAELDALTTTSEDAVKAIVDELNVIDSRLLTLRDAIDAAQRDADDAKANMVKFGERYADNTIGIGKNNDDIITVPPANKTGIEKCATGIGGAALAFLPVMLLASTAVSQVYIPGISEQMANAQKQLGAFNPELAGFVSRNAGPIAAVLASAGLLGVMAIPGLCGEDSMFDAIGESLSSKRASEAKAPAKVN